MNFLDYQHETAKTAVYPQRLAVEYLGLGIASEAGEVAGVVKKVVRDNDDGWTWDYKERLIDELGDVLWYVSQMCTEFGWSLESIAKHNVQKLQARQEAGELHGR